ncbi:superoxide dismutase family protein [Jeotgalibacillus marinus]|uniref:Superoxide dismutase family protein n=1 Tax=Jeotgalibacillus marinus TaxID=86667 RepID=A0ABV3Q520_9BACL
MKNVKSMGMMLLLGIIVSGCSAANNMSSDEPVIPVNDEAVPSLEIDLVNSEGDKVGMASLTETSEGVLIGVKAEGLEPGEKGIHIHETASCKIPDFTSAGAHFNPGHKEHGFENPAGYHAGDLPNIEIDQEGNVDLELIAKTFTLKQGVENSLLDSGSALIIHEGPDDYKTDPTGESGGRMVCGEIKN